MVADSKANQKASPPTQKKCIFAADFFKLKILN